MKLFVIFSTDEEARFVIMFDGEGTVSELRTLISNNFHSLFPGKPPLCFFRMSSADGFFLTGSLRVSEVLEDGAEVFCHRSDAEARGAPLPEKPSASELDAALAAFRAQMTYVARAACHAAMRGAGSTADAMSVVVAMVMLGGAEMADVRKEALGALQTGLAMPEDAGARGLGPAALPAFVAAGGMFALLSLLSPSTRMDTDGQVIEVASKLLEELCRSHAEALVPVLQDCTPVTLLHKLAQDSRCTVALQRRALAVRSLLERWAGTGRGGGEGREHAVEYRPRTREGGPCRAHSVGRSSRLCSAGAALLGDASLAPPARTTTHPPWPGAEPADAVAAGPRSVAPPARTTHPPVLGAEPAAAVAAGPRSVAPPARTTHPPVPVAEPAAAVAAELQSVAPPVRAMHQPVPGAESAAAVAAEPQSVATPVRSTHQPVPGAESAAAVAAESRSVSPVVALRVLAKSAGDKELKRQALSDLDAATQSREGLLEAAQSYLFTDALLQSLRAAGERQSRGDPPHSNEARPGSNDAQMAVLSSIAVRACSDSQGRAALLQHLAHAAVAQEQGTDRRERRKGKGSEILEFGVLRRAWPNVRPDLQALLAALVGEILEGRAAHTMQPWQLAASLAVLLDARAPDDLQAQALQAFQVAADAGIELVPGAGAADSPLAARGLNNVLLRWIPRAPVTCLKLLAAMAVREPFGSFFSQEEALLHFLAHCLSGGDQGIAARGGSDPVAVQRAAARCLASLSQHRVAAEWVRSSEALQETLTISEDATVRTYLGLALGTRPVSRERRVWISGYGVP